MPLIRLTTRCYPTEDRDRIVQAILSLFPDADLRGDDLIEGTAWSLETFAEQLRKQRIRAAARSVLLRNMKDNAVSFALNKQVATVGKVSFSEERQPLGDIEVWIESENIRALVEGLVSEAGSEEER